MTYQFIGKPSPSASLPEILHLPPTPWPNQDILPPFSRNFFYRNKLENWLPSSPVPVGPLGTSLSISVPSHIYFSHTVQRNHPTGTFSSIFYFEIFQISGSIQRIVQSTLIHAYPLHSSVVNKLPLLINFLSHLKINSSIMMLHY